MDLIAYLRLLRRRWWIVVLAIIVCVGGAIGGTRLEHARYRSSTRLLVSGASPVGVVDELTRRQLAEERAVLFSQISTTDPVVQAAEAAAATASPGADVAGAAPAVSAGATGADPFLTITVSANTAAAAQAIAAAYVQILPTELNKLDQIQSAITTLLTTVTPAGLPSTPFSPQPKRNALIGFALGVVLGVAAALIRETLDTTLRDSDEVRRLSRIQILGVIPREFADEPLPAATRSHSRRSEAYRHVRTNLEFSSDDAPRSFVVTSAGKGEGKSSTAANLALLISRAGKDVVVVDADLRKPSLAGYFNAEASYGLTNVLSGSAQLDDMLQQISGERITVLASGPVSRNPSEMLSSDAMEHLLTELHERFDIVIVDTPPVLAVTDALLAGKHTDGMIIVARMRSTTRSALRRSIEAIERVHARLLGVIVNAAVEAEDKRYGYGQGYVSAERSADARSVRTMSANGKGHPVATEPATGLPAYPSHSQDFGPEWDILAHDQPVTPRQEPLTGRMTRRERIEAERAAARQARSVGEPGESAEPRDGSP